MNLQSTSTKPAREQRITKLIHKEFSPVFFDLENESHKHSVPPNSETHFKMLVVSEKFAGQTRINRQRMLLAVLDEEMKSGLHAISMKALSPEEWRAQNEVIELNSPPCLGGGKHDK